MPDRGTAASRTSPRVQPVKGIAYGVGTRAASSRNARPGRALEDGGVDTKTSQPRKYTSDLYYGALHGVRRAQPKVIAKAVTDIEIRRRARPTPRRRRLTRCQETAGSSPTTTRARRAWRFNAARRSRRGRSSTRSGRRNISRCSQADAILHPVNWDKLPELQYLLSSR